MDFHSCTFFFFSAVAPAAHCSNVVDYGFPPVYFLFFFFFGCGPCCTLFKCHRLWISTRVLSFFFFSAVAPAAHCSNVVDYGFPLVYILFFFGCGPCCTLFKCRRLWISTCVLSFFFFFSAVAPAAHCSNVVDYGFLPVYFLFLN